MILYKIYEINFIKGIFFYKYKLFDEVVVFLNFDV